ncbi:MAG: hypothetical protein JJU12_02575 [Chlamydiales bacterium]|nr:hypothetical protein [Chlamydiales bacterium]
MRIEHIVLSLIALFLSFCLIACGLLVLIFPEVTFDLRKVGIFCLSGGLLLLLVFALMMRRRYLLLKMGGAAVHEKLIRHFAKEAVQNLFPSQSVDCDVILHKKGKIEILANLPYLSDIRREEKLKEIEVKLSADLLKYCGCKDPFIFNVSFF